MITTILILEEYPQLKMLAWNRALTTIGREEAFCLYEANWRWVEQDDVTEKEASLIKALTDEFGHGVMNVS
jgi:hypothetical protein